MKKISEQIKLFAWWFFGVTFILTGLVRLGEGSIFAAILGLMAGALLLPPFHVFIKQKLNKQLSAWAFIAPSFLMYAALALIPPPNAGDKSSSVSNETPSPAKVDVSAGKPEVASPSQEDQAEAKIRGVDFSPYDPKSYPDTLKKIGGRNEEASKLRRLAALKAAGDGSCDKVEISEVSDKSIPSNIVIFVDCSNSKRFVFSEKELGASASATVLSQKDRAVNEVDARSACQDAATKNAAFPSSVDVSYMNTSSKTYETGLVRVEVPFEAKNALGNEMPYLATCEFPLDSDWTISVKPR